MGGRLSAMKKRLEFQPNLLINPSGDRVSSSAIISNLEPTPRLEGGREGQGPEVHNLEKDSHTNSPLKKKPKNKGKKPSNFLFPASFGCVLEKESRGSGFMDSFLLTKDAKLGLAKMPLEDALSRVQRMLLRPTTYVQDAEVKDSNLHAEFVEQTTLQGKVKDLKNAKASSDLKVENPKKQVSELKAKIEELDISVKNAEHAAMDRVFNAKWSVLDQIRLIAHDFDVSKVSAFKKVADGKIVPIL
ncbi:hypothetical protein AHAS_Ahas16G0124100 [Arachis hypogaea]